METKNDTLHSLLALSNEVGLKLLESGGEITPDIESHLQITEQQLPQKVDSYSFVLDRLDADAAFFQMLAEEYKEKAKHLKDAHQRLKDRLKDLMLHHGVMELKGERHKFKLSPSRSAIEIENEALVPREFKIQVVTEKVNKEALREKLEKGESVPGVELRPTFSLRKT